jgi:hypothetical protein
MRCSGPLEAVPPAKLARAGGHRRATGHRTAQERRSRDPPDLPGASSVEPLQVTTCQKSRPPTSTSFSLVPL